VTRRLLGLLAFAYGMAVAAEFPGYRTTQPVILRLDGHFTADRASAATNGADAVSMLVGDSERWLSATKARTLGDRVPLGRDVLAALRPIHPNLVVVGSRDLVRRLAEAAPGMPVEVEGLVSFGGRQYLLRRVVVGAPAP
jgi:pimeloyl-ACP methyl ester carboxylesterase